MICSRDVGDRELGERQHPPCAQLIGAMGSDCCRVGGVDVVVVIGDRA